MSVQRFPHRVHGAGRALLGRVEGRARRPRWIAAFDLGAVVAAGAIGAMLAGDLGTDARDAPAWVVPVAIVLGIALADLVSGVAHWFCDTFFAEDTPVLGAILIAPFREHHRAPEAITTHGFAELNGNTCASLLPLLAATVAADVDGTAALLVRATVLTFATALVFTNQLHSWAHQTAPPPAVRWLQARGLVLTPTAHDRHHRGGFTRAYCITTGWLNAPLDRFEVFPRLTRALRSLGRTGAFGVGSSRSTPLG